MNDYALINALLDDGSPQAILKLKIIIDFNCSIEFDKIDKKYLLYFIELFKENFSKYFTKNSFYIFHTFPYGNEIAEMFPEIYNNNFYQRLK